MGRGRDRWGRCRGERERERREGIERVLMIVFIVVVVGCNLEKRFFILTLTTWETTERSERARAFFVGERWRGGTDSTVVSRRRGRRRSGRGGGRGGRGGRVVWGLWWWTISRVRRREIRHRECGVWGERRWLDKCCCCCCCCCCYCYCCC